MSRVEPVGDHLVSTPREEIGNIFDYVHMDHPF